MLQAFTLLARSDGIAVTLSPLSKIIVAGVFLVILGLVIRVVTYRKSSSQANPSEPSDAQE